MPVNGPSVQYLVKGSAVCHFRLPTGYDGSLAASISFINHFPVKPLIHRWATGIRVSAEIANDIVNGADTFDP
jgi:hypothetical protein